MATFFLVIIYLAFISLGLPDSLLGSAWPIMHLELNAPMSFAGIISMIVSGGTIVSSLSSGFLLSRFGTGKVTFVSVLMTAVALLGFSLSDSFLWLCVLAIPLGLGAGAVDSGLNSFVAAHYKARHMSWLHCFWGIGATCGPIIMAAWIARSGQWRNGYLTVSLIQFALVLTLLFTLPLWKRFDRPAGLGSAYEAAAEVDTKARASLAPVLCSFLCYCSIESTTGIWGASYLVSLRGLHASTAARWISMFYLGITVGRLLSGFVTIKLSGPKMIRLGEAFCAVGVLILMFALPTWSAVVGLLFIGLGLAPVFPGMLHETPVRFGTLHAQRNMGYQMASAYVGSTFMPPIFGFVASRMSMALLPFLQMGLLLVMTLCCEATNRQMRQSK
jgi:fucose permease